MPDLLAAAAQNLLSPPILSFALGLLAGLARAELEIPDAVAKGLAVYLIFAIGLKGGVAVAGGGGADLGRLLPVLAAAAALSFLLPLAAFALLRLTTALGRVDAAAVSAHYGSVSIVTYVAAAELLRTRGVPYEGYMTAVVAVMETPAIVTGLLLAGGASGGQQEQRRGAAAPTRALLREVLLNGSVVLLLGAFAIGLVAGAPGWARVAGFFEAPFQGILCLFLLEMGLLVARRLRAGPRPGPGALAFALYMPLLGAAAGLAAGAGLGLSAGGTAILATLCASASYIAVPAALRLALPRANPSLSLSLSLGVTFPFNVVLGVPLYLDLAGRLVAGGGTP
jgi:uncharacterized protein